MTPKPPFIDTNVIVRYLVEDPARVAPRFAGVFSLFPRLQSGEVQAELCDLVLFEVFFVLTLVYRVPRGDAAEALLKLTGFSGIVMRQKSLARSFLRILKTSPVDLVDAYLLALIRKDKRRSLYSFDSDFVNKGVKILDVK